MKSALVAFFQVSSVAVGGGAGFCAQKVRCNTVFKSRPAHAHRPASKWAARASHQLSSLSSDKTLRLDAKRDVLEVLQGVGILLGQQSVDEFSQVAVNAVAVLVGLQQDGLRCQRATPGKISLRPIF